MDKQSKLDVAELFGEHIVELEKIRYHASLYACALADGDMRIARELDQAYDAIFKSIVHLRAAETMLCVTAVKED